MIPFFKHFNKITVLMLSLICCSCTDDAELSDMCFVGDSLVARWDLQASFPTSIVKNYGVSGSGVDYLESLAGKFEGRTVVVISGTNDLGKAYDDAADYAARYIAAIRGLKGTKVYLYCIFPRGEQFEGKQLNPFVRQLNALIEDEARTAACNIHYIDVFDSLLYRDILNPQYTYDGLHLNEYGYAIIADAIK